MIPDSSLLCQAWRSGERLVIADWVETQRPSWAELIRIESDPADSLEKRKRRHRLIAHLEKSGAAWPRFLFDWDWDQGVVEGLDSTVKGWKRLAVEGAGDPVLSCWKDGRIRLGTGEETEAGDIISAFPNWEEASLLSSSRVNIERFLHHPATHRLKKLDLSGLEIEGGAIRGMEQSGLLQHLRCLDLSFCQTVGDRAVRELARTGSPTLEELDLRGSNMTRGGLEALFQSPHFPALRILRVDLFDQEKSGAFRGHDLRRTLEDSPLWQTLEELDLNGIHLQPHEWDALSQTRHWTRLKRVGLARSLPSPALVAQILGSETLEFLDLAGNRLHGGSLLDLVGSGRPPRLQGLRLDENPIGDKALVTLVKTGWFAGLKKVELRSVDVGKPAMVRVAGALADHPVDYLALGGNFLGDVSLPAMLDGLGLVDELDLGGTSVDEPMARLFRERFPPGVRMLTLGPVALGLELSHLWRDPGRLTDLEVLGVFRAHASAMPEVRAPDLADLTQLMKGWPEPGLIRVVNENGTLVRRRPHAKKPG